MTRPAKLALRSLGTEVAELFHGVDPDKPVAPLT